MNNTAILDRFTAELAQSSPNTMQGRRRYAQMWLDSAGPPPWGRDKVIAFLQELEKRYSGGTCRNIYSVVKRVCDAARAVQDEERGQILSTIDPADPAAVATILKALATPPVSWPMGKREGPAVVRGKTLALPLESAKRMIQCARAGGLDAACAAFLALSTVYGPRRGELCLVTPEHIDYRAKTVQILTAKGGEQRAHLLPEAIIPYLRRHDFSRAYTLFGMSRLFLVTEYKAGLEHQKGVSWHGYRHLLDSLLLDAGLPMPQVKTFLRWKLGASAEMALGYYRAPAGLDQEVFRVHPLLALWENGVNE